MRRAVAVLALGMALVVAVMVRGNAAGPPASKIGYVNLQRTLNETKVGKKAKERLEAEKKEKQSAVDKRKEEFKRQVEELDKQRVVLKPDVAAQREKELQDKYLQLQEYFVELQQELAKKEAKLTQDIFGKAASIIESIAKRDGYTMMLEKTESAILWADPTADITSEVNRRLDAGEGGK